MDVWNKEQFGSDMMSIEQLEKQTIFSLINTNPEVDESMPLPAGVIPVGGLQVKDPKPLADELDSFISGSESGAVLFSLGTNVRSEFMSKEKQNVFLDVFRQMPKYRFLWKLENNTNELHIPENVMISQWLPQSDILAHPKIKAFITHSGLLSTHETIWRGVPVLSIPFAFDQNKVIKTNEYSPLSYYIYVSECG